MRLGEKIGGNKLWIIATFAQHSASFLSAFSPDSVSFCILLDIFHILSVEVVLLAAIQLLVSPL